jgi:cysteine desulfurase NifS
MGGGGPLGSKAWQDCNVNELTDLENYDPISGFPVYKALLCEVVREGGGAEPSSRTRAAQPHDVLGAPPAEALAPQRESRVVNLDHNASTPIHPDVLQAMMPYLREHGGNPSSIHGRGAASREAVEAARRKLAALINSTARRIVFTGGGTEADNLAIKGAARALEGQGRHLITSAVEHPAVLEACAALEADGFETSVLRVDADGLVDPAALEAALRADTVLVSIMLANNELGTVQPVAECARLCRERGVLFHTDAVQGLGKIRIDVAELDVDMLSVSAHKLYGPKGVGALYVRSGIELWPLLHGGGQERRLRAGTENVAGIAGFGKACELAQRRLNSDELDRVAALRDALESRLCALIPDARPAGAGVERTPNTTNLVLPGLRGESLVLALDRHGVYFSSGSACKSGNPDPSHVLRAIGLTDDEAHCSIRLSLGVDITEADVNYVLEVFDRVVRESRTTLRFVGCR